MIRVNCMFLFFLSYEGIDVVNDALRAGIAVEDLEINVIAHLV